MQIKILLIILFSLYFGKGVNAQNTFKKTYGTALADEGHAVLQTKDGGYISAGITYPVTGNRKIYLVKTDASGNSQWSKTLGNYGEATLKSIEPTTDGGYIIGGSYSNIGMYLYLIKTDAAGNEQWFKNFGKQFEKSWGYSAQQTRDGGYIICGSTDSKDGGALYLVKTDGAGNTVWEKNYGGDGYDVGFSVRQSADGGYIVTGKTESFGNKAGALYLLKVSSDGKEEWSKIFPGQNNFQSYGSCVRQTTDGGYIVTGNTGSKTIDVFLVKTDATGNKRWAKSIGSTDEDHGRSVEQTADGGYIVGGFTRSFKGNIRDRDFYLIKTDGAGTEQWKQTYGGTGDDIGISCKPTTDGGYIFCGYTNSSGAGNNDMYLVKTGANGQ